MNHSSLKDHLCRVSRFVLLCETLKAACATVAILLGLGLLAVVLDAGLSLPVWGLVGVDVLLAAAGLVMIGKLLRTAYRHRYRPRRIARHIEKRMSMDSSALINAVDLSADYASDDSGALRRLAIDHGTELASGLRSGQIIDARSLGRWAAFAGAAVMLVTVTVVAAPGVYRSVLPRLLNPLEDSAPFTLLNFDISIEPETVYRGRPAKILVGLNGPTALPAQANVVFLDESDRTHVMPMVRTAEGRFLLDIDRPDRSRSFYIDTPAGRSERSVMVVHEPPVFQQVVADYKFPSYTRWKPGQVVLEAGNTTIKALEGTTVHVRVKSNQALRNGLLTLKTPTPSVADSGPKTELTQQVALLPMEDDASLVEGAFVLERGGSYSIMLTAESGIESNGAFQGKLLAVEDRPPEVEFVAPAPSVIVPETWKVDVKIIARDDVAVKRVRLLRGVNGWGPTPAELKLEGTPMYATASYTFDLPALGARAGDVITYYASAQDGRGLGQFTETAIQVISVISEEQYLQQIRASIRMRELANELAVFQAAMDDAQREGDRLRRQMEELLKRVDKNGGNWSEADKQKLRELFKLQKKHAARLRSIAQAMEKRAAQPRIWDDLEEQMTEALLAASRALKDQAGGLDDLGDKFNKAFSGGMSNAQAQRLAEEAMRLLGKATKPSDERMVKAAKNLELVRKADELAGLVGQLNMLAIQQRELADRMAEFRNRERLTPAEQMRARRMAEEQAELRSNMIRVMAAMRKAAAGARNDLPKMTASVKKLLGDIKELDVLGDQLAAVALAAAGDGRYAYQAAESAASKLDSLCRDCSGNIEGDATNDLDRALGLTRQSIRNLMQSLRASRGLPDFGTGKSGAGTGGYYGSRVQSQILGPHSLAGRGENPQGQEGQTGRGRGDKTKRTATGYKPAGGHEVLMPDADSRQSHVRPLVGVPPQYRELVEAYFRRLADESK